MRKKSAGGTGLPAFGTARSPGARVAFPAPAGFEHRLIEDGLREGPFGRSRVEEVENIFEREAMLLAERR